ncbi:hypothetical protein [Streptomyces phaeofaciens]|uniref:hypothetical protein n=1 Tax=Streptomyces phaeofaciens TaxID=68254 RepID=UPI00369804BB
MNEDELLARLQAADLARVPTAPPDIDRLLEAAMTTTRTPVDTGTPRRNLRPRLLAAAAAAVLAVGGLIAWQVTRAPAAAPSAAPLVLTVQGTAGSTKCAAPTVDLLRMNSTAFEGTATSVTDDQVSFDVKHWYRGDAGVSTVTLQHIRGLEGVTFTAGDRYLVTARDGEVGMCGGTAWAEPQMRDLYRQAFPSER